MDNLWAKPEEQGEDGRFPGAVIQVKMSYGLHLQQDLFDALPVLVGGFDQVGAAGDSNDRTLERAFYMEEGVQQSGVAAATDQHQSVRAIQDQRHIVPIWVWKPIFSIAHEVIGTASLWFGPLANLTRGPDAWQDFLGYSAQVQVGLLAQRLHIQRQADRPDLPTSP